MAKKIKKAILAGLTAYAASKMLKKPVGHGIAEDPKIYKKAFMHDLEEKAPLRHGIPDRVTYTGKRSGPKTWKDKLPWWLGGHKEGGTITASAWKKHGGSIRTHHARLGKMIKAAQGTYAREDESLGMRLGKGKGTAKERDMSYGDWGKRKHDWAKSGKMIKAKYGTEVRTMGSNPHVPSGGTAYVKTKLNGTLKVKTF